MKDQLNGKVGILSAENLETFAYDISKKTKSAIKVLNTYTNALSGIAVKGVTEEEVLSFVTDKRVKYVSQNAVVSVASCRKEPVWGLDRIDQRDLPLDDHFAPMKGETGEGVYAYIIDSGIETSHREFGGRAKLGIDIPGDGIGYDHGTHVAGIVGGKTYGVAPDVILVDVKVLDYYGSGTIDDVIAGVDWVYNDAKGKSAVANMSLKTPQHKPLNDAVKNLVDSGVLTVAAAGSDNEDACDSSQASEPAAITVGATDSKDKRGWFSNYGKCVDIFAPGVDIMTATGNATAISTYSGTSEAAPHVTGALALYLENGYSPDQALENILSQATADKVQDAQGSPNKLLYIGRGATSTPSVLPSSSPSASSQPTTTEDQIAALTAKLKEKKRKVKWLKKRQETFEAEMKPIKKRIKNLKK